MLMFLSSFYGIIDSKNRAAIPSTFRSTINNSKEKTFLVFLNFMPENDMQDLPVHKLLLKELENI